VEKSTHGAQLKTNGFMKKDKKFCNFFFELKKMADERTYIMIKPDGVQRNLVGEIIGRFERKGYQLVALDMRTVTLEHAQEHYKDLKEKPFYKGLCDYIISGPVVAMVWQGRGVVKGGRTLIGATNPAESTPGTIRGDLCIEVGRNIIHGSDSVESAQHEINLWFGGKLNNWTPTQNQWLYERK